MNTAAKQFSVKANENFNMSVEGAAEKININDMCFEPFDINSIRTGSDLEYACQQVYSKSPDNLQPLKEVITRQLEQGDPNKFQMFKVVSPAKPDEESQVDLLNPRLGENKVHFFKIKTKEMLYLGQPVVTIFIREKTKQVKNMLDQVVLREENVKRQQAETFTSLVSHEIRTPLNSTIFFLKLILTLILKYPNLPEAFVN